MRLPRVAVIAAGGTIESLGADRLDLSAYLETGRRTLQGELLDSLPELDAIADVRPVPFRRVPAHALTDADEADLRDLVAGLLDRDEADGVVITHGTNTLEETAYTLHLTVGSDRPVVVSGAMRPASALSADGPLNLVNAVRVAASPAARGLGTVVVLDDTIHGARDVTKASTSSVAAFEDRGSGPLGRVDGDGRVVLVHRPARLHPMPPPFDPSAMRDLPRVDVVVSYLGADGALIDAAVAAGARGIVSGGTGAGSPTPSEMAALERAAAAGVVICQSSRVGAGRVVRTPSRTRRGWVAGDDLQPWKARILLRLALTLTGDADRIQALFDTC
jgi:L-asparaginase